MSVPTYHDAMQLDISAAMHESIAQEKANSEYPLQFWYAALPSSQIKRGQMRRQMLLNRPLLLLRDARGRAYALDDHCPHRGIPLSFGTFNDDLVECCYHGWKFDCSGKCTAIPALLPDSPVRVERIRARNFPCEESDGLIWVFMSATPARQEPLPPVPRLLTFSNDYQQSVISRSLKCDMDHGIMGLMDPAHGPFVHQSWWWRKRKSIHEKAKRFEPIPNGFRMSLHTPSSNSAAYKLLNLYNQPITTIIDFVLPNRRLEQVRCGNYWFSSQALVTPLTTNECRLDFVAAWNVLRRVPFIKNIYHFFARQFIQQDQRIMERQAVGLRDNPTLILIDDADTQARWYSQLKAAYLKSQRNGGEMEHPMKAPVTLRWRS